MLLSMAKVQIIGTKPCQDKTVQLLHLLGMVQIDAWDEGRSLSQKRMTLSDEAIHLRERLAYLATHVEAVLAALPPLEVTPPTTAYEEFYAHPLELLLYVVESELEEVGPEVRALVARRDQLEEQLGSLPRYEATLRQLLPLMPAIVDLEHFAVTAVWVERRYQAALDTTIRQLNELTEGLCEAMSREVDEDTLVAVLVFPKTEVEAVNKWLDQESITQIRLPTEFSGQPLEKALTNIRWRLEAIPRELAEGEATLETLAENWRPRLSNWLALLRDHQAQIDVRSHFGQTDHTFIIEGWVPRRRLGEMEAALASEVGNEVLVTELPLSAEEQKLAPVMFDNPALVRPFEPLVGLLALPQYGDFDPTPLMFLFFPLFFGLILGDVAYGAILLILMIYLRQRFQARPALRSLAEVMIMGAVWSIVFGFLYGELFGTLGELLGLHPLWFDRGHNVQALFLLTVGIGAGHIVLGLCLGLWLALRRHSHHEVIEKTATLVSLAALFLLVAVLSDYLPASFLTPIIALLVVGLAVLIYSLGGIGIILGPLELLGTVGNILSYLRIAAIGLSSIYLAQVANELAGVAGNLLLGLIIAGLFHALNIVLGAFSPTIQSLRLHYVEFFGKFYEGGGRPFRPFQRSIVQR